MRPLRRIFDQLEIIDVTYLLLSLGFVLALQWPAWLQQPLQWLDQRLLSASYSLSAAPPSPVKIGLAEIPDELLADFTRLPVNHPLTEKLIELHLAGVPFHVFLPSAFGVAGFTQQEDFTALASALSAGEGEATQAQRQLLLARVNELKQWKDFVGSPDIFWFLPWGQLELGGGRALSFQLTASPWSVGLLQWLAGRDQTPAGMQNLAAAQQHYEFLGAGAPGLARLWSQVGEHQKIIAAPLLLAQKHRSLGPLQWSDGQLQAQNQAWFRWVNARGILPVDWRLAPVVLPMNDVAGRLSEFDLLLIAPQSNSEALLTAAAMNTLLADHYPKSPDWAWAWEPMSLLLLALLTAPIWLRAGSAVLILSLVLVSTALVAWQLAAHIYYQWWLPTATALMFIWCAVILRLIALVFSRSLEGLRESWRLGWQQIVREQIGSGKLAEAENSLNSLMQLRHEKWQLQACYDIAQSYEKQRRYEQAEKLYRDILIKAPKFSDVKNRLMRLQELSGSQGTGGLDATLVIDEQIINKPVLGRYEIQKELGRGAMGVVYLGRDPRISRMVAIKTLHYKHFEPSQLPEVKARFFREAEAAGRLSHPNIVSVFDAGEEADLAFIAMDYVPGKALNYFTNPKRLLPVPIVYGLMAKAADALFYAHKHQIIHRDIKPSNLLYDPETGRMKVSDFGIARLVDNSKTRTGDVMGSPLYMSPEQLKGIKVSEAADIYSLGVTMYQLLTGKLPFDGDSLANLTYQILQGKHASVRTHRAELPPSATRITNKALQKDPEDRFANAREMAEAIRKSLARDFE
ncbi:serine/threonine-protein kinase [Simiduia curdlanivorans]|uniref:Protein kinase n=1 Tax=Simiduia curdlanivorans TaxID=1492769 RepID=A0ABV8V6G5_9GAMM|nr:serine/threonine-protein kinase [Simiduia curdlanivorans]MDN3639276.1 serine/threonine-protein kinase [Simiduia curdlanivorans]